LLLLAGHPPQGFATLQLLVGALQKSFAAAAFERKSTLKSLLLVYFLGNLLLPLIKLI
jgi:hypothetical protein